MMRRIAPIAALFLAAIASAQPTPGPKIEKADFKDPGKLEYRFKKGETETFLTEAKTHTQTAVQVMGQEMNINAKGTTRQYMTLKVLDDAVPTRVEVVTDHIQMKQSVDGGMFAMDITVDDKKIKATSGDQVLADTEGKIDNPMVEQFTRGIEHLGKKAVVLVGPDGRFGEKIEGDPVAVKFLRDLPDQTLFPVVFRSLEGLKVGDTWEVETETRSMQQMELTKPVKVKTVYKIVGGATVDGVRCTEIAFSSILKASNIEATTTQAGQEMKMKIGAMSWNMSGTAYYDPACNRPIYSATKGVVEVEASMDVPQAGETDVKVVVDLTAVSWHNVPWK